ncbi:MAG: hypothetical protein FWF79_10565 [Defluviitaleaceae bacterium]|nr:hypothetical protein [Defluviitaleaceae bacterium]
MNCIPLHKTLSRIFFPCKMADESCLVLFDPGSPNSIISLDLIEPLGLKSTGNNAKIKILGLNVLNYFKYTVDRETDPGHIVLELNNRLAPRNSKRGKFNHLLSNNGYYITDEIIS